MYYYIAEKQFYKRKGKHAGIKARLDVSNILSDNGWQKIEISFDDSCYGRGKIKKYYETYREWKRACDNLKQNDVLIIQYPVINHSFLLGRLESELKKRGVKVVVLVHDLNSLRMMTPAGYSGIKKKLNKCRQLIEENSLLKNASSIIVHNEKMKEYLESKGIRNNEKIVMQLFDSYNTDWDKEKHGSRILYKEAPVIIAGNLSREKSGFIYDLPDNQLFNLYGINYNGDLDGKVNYCGVYAPNELPNKLEGSFGLVWDGPSSKNCIGKYGAYLKYNSPHKTSLYLSSEVPVIIWKNAALADFIEKNNLGLTINSLDEIHDKIDALTEEDYNCILENVKEIALDLRRGGYTLKAVDMSK